MKLRPATAADVPALALVAERSYRYGFADILEEDVLALRDAQFFAAHFDDKYDRMTVADDGVPIGFLLVSERHIDMLFVDPAFLAKGAGSRLLAHAEEQGARSLECFRDNGQARHFYERHGWRVDGCYEREFAGKSRSFVFYVKEGREKRT